MEVGKMENSMPMLHLKVFKI